MVLLIAPQQAFFLSILNYRGRNRQQLCLPFLKLSGSAGPGVPTLAAVRDKVEKNGYASIEDIAFDVEEVFEMARDLYPGDPKLHSNADTMLNFIRSQVQAFATENGNDDDPVYKPEIESFEARPPPPPPPKARSQKKEYSVDGSHGAAFFDQTDRELKSERFNNMQRGDVVVIRNNARAGHHDVTGKRAYLNNKQAIVLETAVWPNTWLSLRVIESGEQASKLFVLLRTSNLHI